MHPQKPRKNFKKRLEKKGKRFVVERVKGSPTSRSFAAYLEDLGLTEKELVGKSVLDIGAGESTFVKDAKSKGINAAALEPRKIRGIKAIRKSAQSLNIENKFDFVLSYFAVPHYLSNAFNVRLSFYNMLRALKKNGRLIICPIQREHSKKGKPLFFIFAKEGIGKIYLNTLFNKLNQCGFRLLEPRETGIGLTIEIFKTPKSDLKKLGEWLSLKE